MANASAHDPRKTQCTCGRRAGGDVAQQPDLEAELRSSLRPEGTLRELLLQVLTLAGTEVQKSSAALQCGRVLSIAERANALVAANAFALGLAAWALAMGPRREPLGPENDEAPHTDADMNKISDNWRARLAFDAAVSDCSPVVRGTWVTVRHVVSLVIDGWTWADILRAHPELTEDDIRACLRYTVEEENGSLAAD